MQSCAHTWPLSTHTHTHFIILIFTAHLSFSATCGPCESPWTLRSWPVKPLNVFHMFCTCRAGLHMPLCHTSRYPTLSIESQILRVWPLIIPGPRHYWSSFWRCRLPSALVLACNTYPCLTLSRQPHDHRQFSGVSPSWLTALRPHVFLLMMYLCWTVGSDAGEMCSIWRSFHTCLFFLIRAEALSKHPHVSHLKCLWLVSCWRVEVTLVDKGDWWTRHLSG